MNCSPSALREPWRDEAARGRASQWVSRVHVDDICGVLLASAAAPRPGAIYNVADGAPSLRAEALVTAAQALGLRDGDWRDPGRPPGGGRSARAAGRENKRVRAALLKSELCYELKHPTLQDGLAAILAAEESEERGGFRVREGHM